MSRTVEETNKLSGSTKSLEQRMDDVIEACGTYRDARDAGQGVCEAIESWRLAHLRLWIHLTRLDADHDWYTTNVGTCEDPRPARVQFISHELKKLIGDYVAKWSKYQEPLPDDGTLKARAKEKKPAPKKTKDTTLTLRRITDEVKRLEESNRLLEIVFSCARDNPKVHEHLTRIADDPSVTPEQRKRLLEGIGPKTA